MRKRKRLSDTETAEKMGTSKTADKINLKISDGKRRCLDIWTAKKIGAAQDGMTRQILDGYTMGKLRETLIYAANRSPFYKRKYSGIMRASCSGFVLADGDGIEKDGNCGFMRPDRSGCISSPVGDADFLRFFQSLPFTTQAELRESGMDFLCVRPGEISRIVTLDTGGSTGTPKRVHFTEEDQQLTVDYFQNGMQLLVSACDTVLILMPVKIPGSIGKLLARGLGGFGAKTVEYGLPQMRPGMAEAEIRREAERLLDLIETEQVTAVVALPTHMRMLAETAVKRKGGFGGEAFQYGICNRFSREAGKPAGSGQEEKPAVLAGCKSSGQPDSYAIGKSVADRLACTDAEAQAYVCGRLKGMEASGNPFFPANHLRLKCVLLSAEYVDEKDVQFIEQVFSCKVYEHYGMTEMGLGCAVSCGHGAGYHVREADLYLEIIDPGTQAPVRDGQLGEIVFTTLTRKGMPFIRYRTGDYSRWITEKCPCGSLLKRLDKVRPRNAVKGYLRER